MYDDAARFFQTVLGCIEYAKSVLNVVPGHPASRVMSHYWGAHQRFFRQFCMAMKVPKLVEIAKRALAEGKCVVVGLQTTGEARLDEAVEKNVDLDEFAGMRAALDFLMKKFPTGQWDPDAPNGNGKPRGAWVGLPDDARNDEDEVDADEIGGRAVTAVRRNRSRRPRHGLGGNFGESEAGVGMTMHMSLHRSMLKN